MWRNDLIEATFSPGGRAMLQLPMPGMSNDGRWSADAAGTLHAGIAGDAQSGDAWIVGDRLTIVAEGRALTFHRKPGA